MIYGYCRVSTSRQRITRQVNNIIRIYNEAHIIREFYTGTTQSRPLWDQLIKKVKKGDTIVFDSVSRMSRNSVEGFNDYKDLYNKGIKLVFLKEPLINSDTYDQTKNNLLNININCGNEAFDKFFKGNIELINNLLMSLAEEQIKLAFDQAQKEVDDLHIRISEGMRESKKEGYKVGLKKGTKLVTKVAIRCKDIIKKHCKDFGGSLGDEEVLKLCGCNRNSFYKYKREIKNNL